jgi:hypothetical protein
MIKKVITQIHIHAPPARIWEILADTENYPCWNPFIRKISGKQIPRAYIKLSIAVSPAAVISLYARLNIFEHGKTISWTGPFSIPGIFHVEHFFRIAPDGSSSAIFFHEEFFSGAIGLIMGFFVNAKLVHLYNNMNAALKTRAEQ